MLGDNWTAELLAAHRRFCYVRSTSTPAGRNAQTAAVPWRCGEGIVMSGRAPTDQGLFFGVAPAPGMMGGTKAHYDCITVFSETDHTEDLPKIDIPLLIIHSEDDQIVPFKDSAPMAVKLAPKGVLKVYKDLPHGMPATHAELINADLLSFIGG
jgi:pimeloyl-ACP methyl ester carboxylesterase